MNNKVNGGLLERIVASLHAVPGVRVDVNARVRPVSGSGRPREVDVLISTSVAGYPVRFAIECKNEHGKIGAPRIDQFVGMLKDIGIAPHHGIYVSTNGYTSDALRRAGEVGVRTLTVSGLSRDGLSSLLNQVLLSTVHLLADIQSISVPIPDAQGYSGLRYVDGDRVPRTSVPDLFWHQWVSGDAKSDLGVHAAILEPPSGLSLCDPNVPLEHQRACILYRVRALVFSISGSGSLHALHDARSETIEKVHVEATVQRQEIPACLQAYESEESLTDFVNSQNGVRIIHRVRVPRFIFGRIYWPPSAQAVERLTALLRTGENPGFLDVEGQDIERAWSEMPLMPGFS